jgi:hypothetical protein
MRSDRRDPTNPKDSSQGTTGFQASRGRRAAASRGSPRQCGGSCRGRRPSRRTCRPGRARPAAPPRRNRTAACRAGAWYAPHRGRARSPQLRPIADATRRFPVRDANPIDGAKDDGLRAGQQHDAPRTQGVFDLTGRCIGHGAADGRRGHDDDLVGGCYHEVIMRVALFDRQASGRPSRTGGGHYPGLQRDGGTRYLRTSAQRRPVIVVCSVGRYVEHLEEL